jgi:pyruvate/2-oxoglutarate dehydrogenase complex dihydrolipoamide dehydrogenase (E3) component
MSAEDAYVRPDETGERVAILGAGLVGIELAIYLGMLGKKVSVIEMLDRINDGGNMMHAKSLPVEIKKYGIDVILSTRAEEITASGVRCMPASGEGEEIFMDADSVIYAVGQRPLQDEAAAMYECAPLFYPIGDCVMPKNIMAATSAAYEIARNIGKGNR